MPKEEQLQRHIYLFCSVDKVRRKTHMPVCLEEPCFQFCPSSELRMMLCAGTDEVRSGLNMLIQTGRLSHF